VGFSVHVEQLRCIDVRVALRRAQAGVPKQFLDSTQIGAALKQVSGKGMA
jgi:hypothetical protein